ncbi:hypothetical protein RIF29_39205 [Crotalaria pallida]|uniref:DUF4408 domain-containing protein n=1 Tax=Crotalaria pallida TaxID=3830 RepID=A0AAN9E0P2_CROPI
MGFLNVKLVLISTGILSMAMGLKLSFPLISHFLLSELAPSISTFFLKILTPPYLYILLNFIILTILASSKFHLPHHTSPPLQTQQPLIYPSTPTTLLPPLPQPLKISPTHFNAYNGVVSDSHFFKPDTTPLSIDTVINGHGTRVSNYDGFDEQDTTPLSIETVINGSGADGYLYDRDLPAETLVSSSVVSGAEAYESETTPLSEDKVINSNGCDGYLDEMHAPVKTTVTRKNDAVFNTSGLQRNESYDFASWNDENEKPPVSARFSQRKSVRTSPEGKVVALGVAKSKKQDTLESTWKTITEGRAMPLTRHLKKSDTWEQQARRNAAPLTDLNSGGGDGGSSVMKKSETFSGRENKKSTASAGSGGGGRLRKEPSLSQDELNRRVEAFIKKFNTEMRLQRQESLRQYSEMVNRSGAR